MTTGPGDPAADVAELLAKIDDAQAVIWDRALEGDTQAINEFLRWQHLRQVALGIAE